MDILKGLGQELHLVNKRKLRRLIKNLVEHETQYGMDVMNERALEDDKKESSRKADKAQKALNKYLKELQSLTSYLHFMR